MAQSIGSRFMEIRDATSESYVVLEPVGYQFGSTSGDPFDDNWLMIHGRVRSSTEKWSFRDPALLVHEARELGAWLRSAAAGKATPMSPDPDGSTWPATQTIEPIIGIGLVNYMPDAVTLRFFLWLESAPPSSWASGTKTDMDFHLDLTTTPQSLDLAVDEWESQLGKFPPR
jgi:hypothetical protein